MEKITTAVSKTHKDPFASTTQENFTVQASNLLELGLTPITHWKNVDLPAGTLIQPHDT